MCEGVTGGCTLSLGHGDYCRDCGPCADGEGDCDSDSECLAGLTCKSNVGANYGWASTIDVCEGVTSGCTWSVGDWDYCKDCGPCSSGQGDCDYDSECKSGLICVDDVGANYGWHQDIDVCQSSNCALWPVGHLNYCRDCGPCVAGEGDCDSDSECTGTFLTVCVHDIGADYGWDQYVDVCKTAIIKPIWPIPIWP